MKILLCKSAIAIVIAVAITNQRNYTQPTMSETKSANNSEDVFVNGCGYFTTHEYSEKAFAVIGERTKEFKEVLKTIGGKFNRYLKIDGEPTAGWIFSKRRVKDFSTMMVRTNTLVDEGVSDELIAKELLKRFYQT